MKTKKTGEKEGIEAFCNQPHDNKTLMTKTDEKEEWIKTCTDINCPERTGGKCTAGDEKKKWEEFLRIRLFYADCDEKIVPSIVEYVKELLDSQRAQGTLDHLLDTKKKELTRDIEYQKQLSFHEGYAKCLRLHKSVDLSGLDDVKDYFKEDNDQS